jgi:hypothetical protein
MKNKNSWRGMAASLLWLPLMAVAGPGAHGPNGEHLDGPAGGHVHGPNTDAPRMEAHSDAFELVATLADGELSILIDRYATNEPVLEAKVEVAAGATKAIAKFHADHGDYAIADEAFLKAVSQLGEHALVITINAGKDSDLLDGVLTVTATAHDDHAAAPWKRWLMWGVPGVLILVALVVVARRRSQTAARSAA